MPARKQSGRSSRPRPASRRLIPKPSASVYYVNQKAVEVVEAPPPSPERQAAWERALQLRPGDLAPKACAARQRQRDVYTRQILNELDRVLGLGGVSHVGN